MEVNNVEMWMLVGTSSYYISNHGNVRRLVEQDGHVSLKDISPEVTPKGYRCVSINGKRHRVHRLVAGAFLHNPNNYKYVHHIDGDMSNNRASNLEWVEHCPKKNTK